MKIRTQTLYISGIRCYIRENGSGGPNGPGGSNGPGGPLLFLGSAFLREEETEHLQQALEKLVPEKNFVLAVFQVSDWNRDFSPWPAPAASGTANFAGEGKKTLDWLLGCFVPFMQEKYGADRECYLAGYSLAGLFALWAAYECRVFSGIICCSGSLWYAGWEEYVSGRRIQHSCRVYLSLGGREEKTGNPVLAAVGERTRAQEKLLRSDPSVKSAVLEWNAGGHFADADERLAKGIRWMMEKGEGAGGGSAV